MSRDTLSILVLNGPNLNLLGLREPELYGHQTYADLEHYIRRSAAELGCACEIYQTNHEGVLVDRIQAARGVYDGLVLNAAAYTHTSVAILDALKAVAIPTVEVHLTDIHSREPFRQHSYVSLAAVAMVAGKGFAGYREAMEILKNRLMGEKTL